MSPHKEKKRPGSKSLRMLGEFRECELWLRLVGTRSLLLHGSQETCLTVVGGRSRSCNRSDLKYLQLSKSCSEGSCRDGDCVKECPKGYEKSTLHRCLPNEITSTSSKVFKSTFSFFEEVGSDITLCWKELVLLCVISIGLSLLLLLLFRFCAAIIIWTVLLAVTAASIGITIYLWIKWNEKKGDAETYEGPNKDVKLKNVTYWLIAAIISTVFTVIYLLVIVFMRNKIKLVAALFKEAGKSVSAMPLILLQPIETFISLAAICCFLLLGFICLQTSGKPLVDSQGKVTYPIETFFQVMRWLLLFGFLWLAQFVMACQNFVVAGAVVTWYFTRDKHKLSSPIWRSLCMLICYHLGSIAFGSLIIAIMKAIRALFRLLQKYMDDQNQRCNTFWKIFQCCLACFESYLKFLSKNAYIMIAISGESFCTSARKSFGSLTANILKLAAVDCIGDFILFIGKMGVTISVAFIALEILKNVPDINYIWIPVSLSCVFAFLCCHCFLSVYEMAIDTLMLCFCEDCQMNDGVTRPYFMSKSLMTFVEGSRRNAKIAPPPRPKEID
ncbi:choline transporter-like protein 1 [Trichonephila clavata]|uniref:Choline transporter-like protein n=1 Tax=Trichonephila clavata TaxID=2740835 RepID=A0A8X6KWJ2_TRICU|nr:choline transporter-like protein 1 [Trichonephila clavata]